MSRKEGVCHICGQSGALSFEHVPPRAAFNDRPVVTVKLEDSITLGPDATPRGPIQQRGMGGYTLCERCNSRTGAWYGKRFVDWCYQGMDILVRSNGHPTLIYLAHLFPLSIIKQIVVMFFSVNPVGFAAANQELVHFVLNREARYLSPTYRVFAYYNTMGSMRSVGVSAKFNAFSTQHSILSEISFPPFGYVMTFDSSPPDRRLVEISHFSRYDYQDSVVMEMRLPVLPTHLLYPGDYRSKDQIYQQKTVTSSTDDTSE